MKVDKKKNWGLLLFVLPAIIVPALMLMGVEPSIGGEQESFTYGSSVCVYKNGGLISCHPNTITNVGKDYFKTSIGVGTNNTVNVLVLGNRTVPVAATTNLDGAIVNCGLANATAVYNTNGASSGNWSMAYTWTNSCGGEVVNVTALYKNPGSMGALFGGASFTSTTLQASDQLTVNYTVYVT